MLKQLINQSLKEQINHNKEVALLFSGGVDSLTCLFSLFEIGVQPTLYTFYLENKFNNDLEYSKKVAEFYNLKHVIIEIPYDVEKLMKDVQYIVETLPVDRKTNVQCVHPFLYVIPHIEEDLVVTGLCADDLYGSSKGVSIRGSKDKGAFDAIRERCRSNLNASAYLPFKTLFKDVYNKHLIVPYRDERVYEYFMGLSWSEINKPKQKQVAIESYKSYFDKQNIYRRNSSLQVESGIREYHDELVKTSLNKNNRRRVDEIYKDLMRELK